jgi:LCP family protein required for cell wall assembly
MRARPVVLVPVVLVALAACAWGLLPTVRDQSLAGIAAARLAVNDVRLAALDEPAPSGARVYLVVGSDRRDGTAGPGPDIWGEKADAVMVWVVPPAGAVTLLSLPRDIRVHLAGFGDVKLGGTRETGTNELVGAVRELTGLPVHHYVEVEFAGFSSVVDGLGGVPVALRAPARDPNTGLDLGGGRQVLDGTAALAYVRSRHYEELLDGRWTPAPGDLGRIERQHHVLRELLEGLRHRCPSIDCLDGLLALASSVSVDSGFGGDDVRWLMAVLSRPGAELSATTLPTRTERAVDDAVSPFPPAHPGSTGYRVLEQPAADRMLDDLRVEVAGGAGDD